MPLKLNSTGGGSVTVDVPNTASTYTATLPAETGTVITSATTTGINASALSTGTVPAARVVAGSIIQQVTSTTAVNTSSTAGLTFNTNMTTSDGSQCITASITPTSTSSKILILLNAQAGSSSANVSQYALFRGSTNIFQMSNLVFNQIPSNFPIFMNVLDSPSTTSSTQYQVRMAIQAGQSQTVYFARGTDVTSSAYTNVYFTLLEVKG